MNSLKKRYSINEGFVPVSMLQPGEIYNVREFNQPEEMAERGDEVRVIDVNPDPQSPDYYIVDLEDTEGNVDKWYISNDDRVFHTRTPISNMQESKKDIKILGLKKKSLNENKDYEVKMRPEAKVQIGDDVIYNKQKGNIIGAIGDKWIVQCQYSTYTVDTKDLTSLKAKRDIYGLDQFKFDDKTQKLLFEQMVRCAIYMGNTPVKLQGCAVKYSEWRDSKNEDPIRVLIENSIQLMPKNQIRILEDVNNFANPDNFIEGVIIDESTGEAMESVLINVEDYTSGLGEADMVRILRKSEGESKLETLPKAILKTLAV